MGKNTKSKSINLGSTIFVFGIFLVTISFKLNSADPFNTPKLLIALILSGLISGPLIYSYYKLRVKKNSLELAGILLIFLFIISLTYALFNTDVFIRGLIGETQRRNGYLHYLSMAVVFLYLVRNINFEFAMKLIKASVWLNLILGMYGLLQITGNDFVEWVNPYNSMISTMGNPNFASSILAFFFSIALILLFALEVSIIYKIMALISSIVSLIAITASGSRQGLIVVVITLMFFSSISIMVKNRIYGFLVSSISICLSIFGTLGMLQIGPLQGILFKESVSIRGYYWRAGIEMFKDNLVTGVGLDSYLNYFYKYRESGYPTKYGFEISSSNAHNTIIQMFATGGMFVGLTYFVLLSFVIYCGVKLINTVEKNLKVISILLLSAWVGLQAQSIISIDNIGLSIWSWTFAGMIVGLASKVNSQTNSVSKVNLNLEKSSANSLSNNFIIPRIISSVVMIPIILVVVLLNRAEEQTFYSPALGTSSDKSLVVANSEKIIQNPLADPNYKFKVALNLIDAGYFDQGVDIVKSLSEDDPNQLDYLKLLVRVAMTQNNLTEAVDLRESISILDPWNAQNYFELALLYKSLGDTQQVERIKGVILDINTSKAFSDQAKLELS